MLKPSCKIIPVVKRGHGISKCVDFVEEADKKWNIMPSSDKAKFSKRWLVFDADGRSDFEDGIKAARKRGFDVAFSNMCIEYWFLLHFENHNGKPIPLKGNSHSKAQIELINKHIKAYNKKAKSPIALYDSGSKTVKEDFFDLMMAIDPVTHERRVLSAFKRAKSMHKKKKTSGCEFKESVTSIYELLFALGVIKKTRDGFDIYIK